MPNVYAQIVQEAIGFNTPLLVPLLYMVIRGTIIYFLGITLARFNKKLLGIRTPFNFILFVMLGSIFANAIIDAKTFLPILATMLVLILLNGLMTMLAFYFSAVEHFLKGTPAILVRNGEIQWGTMQKNFITKRELLNELYAQLHTHSLEKVELAILTSDGTINFIQKQ